MMSNDSVPGWLEVPFDSFKPAQIVNIDTLREWSLSQVLRLTSDDGRTLIAKRGIPTSGPTELAIYQECLIPLGVDAPAVIESYASDSEYVLLMEDLGGTNLEQQPTRSCFLEAARKLAEVRASADRVGEISPDVLRKHLLTKEQLARDFDYVVEHARVQHREVVDC